MRALALNADSSSLKTALYELGTLPPLAEPPAPTRRVEVDAEPGEPAGGMVRRVLERLGGAVDVVGHRIVHGGEHFREPTRVTDEVRSQIDELSASAPLHNAAALEGVAAAESALGIAHERSRVAVLVIAAREDWAIARRRTRRGPSRSGRVMARPERNSA